MQWNAREMRKVGHRWKWEDTGYRLFQLACFLPVSHTEKGFLSRTLVPFICNQILCIRDRVSDDYFLKNREKTVALFRRKSTGEFSWELSAPFFIWDNFLHRPFKTFKRSKSPCRRWHEISFTVEQSQSRFRRNAVDNWRDRRYK